MGHSVHNELRALKHTVTMITQRIIAHSLNKSSNTLTYSTFEQMLKNRSGIRIQSNTSEEFSMH